MAEPKRRPHYLQEALLQILQGQRRPLSGRQLAEKLREQRNAVPLSMIFRAIRRLIDRGAMRKILVAGAARWSVKNWSRCCGVANAAN